MPDIPGLHTCWVTGIFGYLNYTWGNGPSLFEFASSVGRMKFDLSTVLYRVKFRITLHLAETWSMESRTDKTNFLDNIFNCYNFLQTELINKHFVSHVCYFPKELKIFRFWLI